jgi:Fe-S-cluster containining protein
MDTPETLKDYEYMRWFLQHDRAAVFTEDDTWYILVHTTCKHLLPNNRCGIYETRPLICREYTTDNCDFHGGEYNWSVLFSSAEQLEKYADEQIAKERAKNRALKAEDRAKVKKRKRRAKRPVFQAAMMAAGGMLPGGGTFDPTRNGNGNGNGKALLSLPVLRK